MVPMRDGVTLATDAYLPSTTGPFPVVLIRTPYGKDAAADIGNGLRDAGVATVAQDTRGRFASGGVDCIFLCDGDGALRDGYDTLAWIAAQAWSNGRVVSWGGSALGIVQYMAAPAQPPGLTAMYVMVGTPNIYQDGFYQHGAFRQALMESWLAGQSSTFFLDVLAAHPLDDGFWDSGQTANRYSLVNVPAIHVGGWFDIFGQGTIDAFVGYQHQGGPGAKGKQKLVMGPWTHAGLGGAQQGQLTYPPQAAQPPVTLDELQLRWLSYYLGLQPSSADVDAIPTVQYYVMGAVGEDGAPGNEWRTADDWPIAAAPVRVHLQPGGALLEDCPDASGGVSAYVYDPANPAPTMGGANLALPAGPEDQRDIEARSDVLTFSTDALSSPVEVTGQVRAHLFVDTNVTDTDVVVRLTDVYPDGRSMLVSDGIQRLGYRNGAKALAPVSPGQLVEAVVDLWSTSMVFAAGHRIRVSVTSSNSPRFWANPNDGSTYRGASAPVPATVSVHHELSAASYVELPVPQRDSATITVCGDPPHDAGTDGGQTPDASSPDAAQPQDSSASESGSGADAAGAGGSGAGGTGQGGTGGRPGGSASDGSDSGCGCRVQPGGSAAPPWSLLALAGLVVAGASRVRRDAAAARRHDGSRPASHAGPRAGAESCTIQAARVLDHVPRAREGKV